VNTPAAALEQLLAPLLAGRRCGLVSEAGVPAVADPGADLVRLAHQHGITVRPLVGPSSLLLAVMASGLNGQSFAFNGYLPTDAARGQAHSRAGSALAREKQTQLLIETPYRNGADARSAGGELPAGHADLRGDRFVAGERIGAHPDGGEVEGAAGGGKMPDFHKKPTVFLLLGPPSNVVLANAGRRVRPPISSQELLALIPPTVRA
jgi:16S rRNA (cytidine1402-2'-O)-methyltransferase